MKGVKASARLERRRKAFDATANANRKHEHHRPGSLKKSFPAGKR